MQAQPPNLDAWVALASANDLIGFAASVDPQDVAAVERLRRDWPPAMVSAALSLAQGRRKLRRKFPDSPHRWDRLWSDREAAEQATSQRVAQWKARRFAERAQPVADLCCGMGGDAMSLAAVVDTLAVDRSELRAWMAGRNAGCPTVVADANELRLDRPLVHLDPARRDEGRGVRRWDPGAFSPTLDQCLAIAARCEGGAIKLGPGLDAASVMASDVELEFISDEGQLAQAVLWTGGLAVAPGARRATILPRGESLVGQPTRAPLGQEDRFGEFLFVPDPALERAGLLGSIAAACGLAERSPGLGILTGPAPSRSPWLTAYRILARPKPKEAEIRAALRDVGASGARVRTRGAAVDADRWTTALRVEGGTREVDVFLFRCGRRLEALVAEPPPEG